MPRGMAVAARAVARDRTLTAAAALLVVAASLYLLGPWPAQPAAPAGTLLVADLRGDVLVALDLARPDAPRRIALPAGPHELIALGDGRVVASLERAGALAVVDLDSGQVELLEVGGTPHGLALDGGTLLFTDSSADAVRRLRVSDWSELPALRAGADPHALAVGEGVVAVANAADSTVTLGDRVVTVSDLPEAVATHGTGLEARFAVAGAAGGAVEILTAEGLLLGQTVVGGWPVRLRYGPRGEVLAAALSASGVVVLLGDGGGRRVAVGGVPDGLAFSSDGRWLFVGDLLAGRVSIVDVVEGRVAARWDVGASAGAVILVAH